MLLKSGRVGLNGLIKFRAMFVRMPARSHGCHLRCIGCGCWWEQQTSSCNTATTQRVRRLRCFLFSSAAAPSYLRIFITWTHSLVSSLSVAFANHSIPSTSHSTCLSISLCSYVSLSLYIPVSLSHVVVSLSLSLSGCLCPCVSLCSSLILSATLSMSFYSSLSLYASLSLYLSVSVPLCLCSSLSLSLSGSVLLCPSLSLALTVSASVSLLFYVSLSPYSFSVSVNLCLCIFLFVSVSVPLYLCLPVNLSLSLHFDHSTSPYLSTDISLSTSLFLLPLLFSRLALSTSITLAKHLSKLPERLQPEANSKSSSSSQWNKRLLRHDIYGGSICAIRLLSILLLLYDKNTVRTALHSGLIVVAIDINVDSVSWSKFSFFSIPMYDVWY